MILLALSQEYRLTKGKEFDDDTPRVESLVTASNAEVLGEDKRLTSAGPFAAGIHKSGGINR
jgi:hypothetical protein